MFWTNAEIVYNGWMTILGWSIYCAASIVAVVLVWRFLNKDD